MHSLYLPNFRTKIDAIPGSTTRLWFQAQEAGRFEIGCAQHCGVSHYKMRGVLIADAARTSTARWLARAETDSRLRYDPADRRRAARAGTGRPAGERARRRRVRRDAPRRPRTARPRFWRRYVFSTDHKVIARQFLFLGLAFLAVGGMLAMLIRWQLGASRASRCRWSGGCSSRRAGGVISPAAYTSLFTMHGTIMIFFAITPILIGGFGNFCIPLMIGARDMAFPRLNMLSFWTLGGGDRDADRVVLRAARRGAGRAGPRTRRCRPTIGTPGPGPDAVDRRRST